MPLTLTAEQRAGLEAAQARSRTVRHWRRYQAVLLRADGVPVATVARSLRCTETSVYNWVAAWRTDGRAGVVEGVHPGRARRLAPAAEEVLETLLAEGDPQAHGYAATGWTVPLLRTELAKRGWDAAERTIRRALHPAPTGLALETSQVRPRTAGSSLCREKKPSLSKQQPSWRPAARCGLATRRRRDDAARVPATAGRLGAARQGQQHIVVISGRNARRVVHGALNVATGELVALVRERSRQDDCAAFVEVLGQLRPTVPKLLVWDNAPPHHPKRVQAAAAAAHITLAFLPFRAPELMPCEDLWRLATAVVAANRAYAAVQEQAERAVAWLAALTPFDRLLKSGLFGVKFQWLST